MQLGSGWEVCDLRDYSRGLAIVLQIWRLVDFLFLGDANGNIVYPHITSPNPSSSQMAESE